MLIPIITMIGIAAVVAWLGYLAVRYLLPTIAASRRAAQDRIFHDPIDYVRAWVARMGPSRMKRERRVVAAQAALDQAIAREEHVLTSFKEDGKEPSFDVKVTAVSLFVLWLVAIVANALIDIPIILSVSGGNIFFAVLGTIVVLSAPIIGSVLLGHFHNKMRSGIMPAWAFSGALAGILAVIAIVVVYLTSLAPIRAEVEYADKIRSVEQQIAMYTEDGDENAVAFAKQNLGELKAQEAQSAEWNTVLIPIAACVEFTTGFFFPIAIPLLLLADAKSSRRKAERALTAARTRVTRQRAREYARLSQEFQRRGLSQLDLQHHLAAVAAEDRVEQAGPEATVNNMAPRELQAPAPAEPSVPPAVANDQAVSAETVTTGETPIGAPPRRDRTEPVERNARTQQTPASPAFPVRGLDDDRSDLIIDLN